MFGKRKNTYVPEVEFDRDKQEAVLKCSICNGDRVAGFKDKQTGHFTEVMFIRDETELKQFMEAYQIEDLRKEY